MFDGISESEINYCQKCWHEFTTMTDKEHQIMEKYFNKKYAFDEPMLYCITNNKYYKTVKEASDDTGVTTVTIYRVLKADNHEVTKGEFKGWAFRYCYR